MEHRFNFFRVCILYCFFSILPSYGTEGSMIPRYLRFTRLRNCSATWQQIYFGKVESQPTRLRSILYPELSFPLRSTLSLSTLILQDVCYFKNLETVKKNVLKIVLIIVNINKDENKSLISNQFPLKNDSPPPLFCGGKNSKRSQIIKERIFLVFLNFTKIL